LGSIKGSFVRLEHAFFPKMSEELTASNVLHEKVNVFAILIHALEVDYKRVTDRFQDLILIANVVNLLGLD
jgi:hypothetical protein